MPTFTASKVAKKQRKVKTIRRDDAVDWIKNHSKGRIFGVDFIKRTNGEKRYMVCRYGVRAYAKGIGLSFDPTAKGLIVVFDIQKMAYRFINVKGMTGILKAGEFFLVK